MTEAETAKLIVTVDANRLTCACDIVFDDEVRARLKFNLDATNRSLVKSVTNPVTKHLNQI